MNNLNSAISKVFKGASKSFSRFPASIICALIISITAIIKITMDWKTQQPYSLLFDSIQISFLLGAIFSMAVVLLEGARPNKKSFFILENISGILLAIISFLLLYFLGGGVADDKIIYLSRIATARVSVAIFISIVAFIYILSKSKAINSFSDSFFITHKAFIVSAIYGLVIMAGVSGVIGAFQGLIYRGMDYRIYQYLGVGVGFLTFAIFLGHFPNFREMEKLDEVRGLKEQPKFILILFVDILIPITIALTVVLLIWSISTIITGVNVSFNRLSSIASSYVIIGIWLHIMVDKHKSRLTEFYKRAYPFAGILILIFEAWALIVEINKFGLKTAEYSFLMIWIFAMVSSLLLIFLKDRAYRKIAITAVVISVIWVMPVVGYRDVTFNSQVNKLEQVLNDSGILVKDIIVDTDKEIGEAKKVYITEAVGFISNSEKSNTPIWFKKDLNDETVFKDTFGFEKAYRLYDDNQLDYSSANFSLGSDVIDISKYSLKLNIDINEQTNTVKTFESERGTYEISVENESAGVPKIKIKLEDRIIIEKDMEKYLSDLLIKYPPKENRSLELDAEDMSLTLESEEISVLLVFKNIDAYFDKRKDKTEYYINFDGIYIKYK